MSDAEDEVSRAAASFVRRVAESIHPSFPHYTYALRDELTKARIGNDGWNRVAAMLASLSGLPGTALSADEHLRRNAALGMVSIAQAMAEITFGGKQGVAQKIEFVYWLMRDSAEQVDECEGLAIHRTGTGHVVISEKEEKEGEKSVQG